MAGRLHVGKDREKFKETLDKLTDKQIEEEKLRKIRKRFSKKI